MKKKLTALVLCASMLLTLCACGGKTAASSATSSTSGSQPLIKTDTGVTSVEQTSSAQVYYINKDASADAAWQQLAKEYTEKTGIPVRVETISENYTDNLSALIDSADAPTIFSVDKDSLKLYEESCRDLTGTDLLGNLLSTDLTITGSDGRVLAAAYTYEVFGMAVNTALLQTAGFKLTDIKNWDSFNYICEQINGGTSGVGAVTAFELKDELWHYTDYILNVPMYYEFKEDNITETPSMIHDTYEELFRNIWDTCITNSPTSRWYLDDDDSTLSHEQFGKAQTVFAVMSSTEFAQYMTDYGLSKETYTMIPIYIGYDGEENAGLCYDKISYWAVNNEVSDEDIQASLDFLTWVVTDSSAAAELTDAYGISPYTSMPDGSNPCLNAGNADLRAGKYPVMTVYDLYPAGWSDNVMEMLTKYTTGYAVWYELLETMRNDWKTLYAAS